MLFVFFLKFIAIFNVFLCCFYFVFDAEYGRAPMYYQMYKNFYCKNILVR